MGQLKVRRHSLRQFRFPHHDPDGAGDLDRGELVTGLDHSFLHHSDRKHSCQAVQQDGTTSGPYGKTKITPVTPPLAFQANALADVIRRELPPAFETFAEFRIIRAFWIGFAIGHSAPTLA